jgi:hypothetical protein
MPLPNQDPATQLNPKLREAYERVMGTVVAPNPTTPSTPMPQAASTPSLSAVPPLKEEVHIPMSSPTSQVFSATAPKTYTSPSVVAPKKKSGVSPLIIAIGAVAFFIIYAVFWIKIFNISLPFLGG